MRFYVICTTPRSGSNFLCRELTRRRQFGEPGEFFNFYGPMLQYVRQLEADNIDDYVDKLIAKYSSSEGIFGWKTFWFDFVFVRELAGKLDRFQPLEYIYLERRDEYAQAVSFTYAQRRKSWIGEYKTDAIPDYDRDHIDRSLRDVRWHRQGWDDYFRANAIEPVRIDYDALIGDPDPALRQVAERLGLPSQLPPTSPNLPSLQAQREPAKAQWLKRYHEETSQS